MNLQSLSSVGGILALVVFILAILFGTGLIAGSTAWMWGCIGALALARWLT